MPRLYLSAAHKSSGKTTLTLGLCRALRDRGVKVQAFKKGPDYIDPIWHGQAAGRPSYNLDFHMMTQDEIATLFAHHDAGADLSLIEGNKGLYDGMDLEGSNSNAALAKLLGAPVVLVLDTQGMTRGVAPLILGYQAFDRDVNIAGIILNKVGGPRHEGKLRAVIEHYTDVKVLGAVRQEPGLTIAERHLGLMPGNESPEAEARIAAIAVRVAEQVDLEGFVSLAQQNQTRSFSKVVRGDLSGAMTPLILNPPQPPFEKEGRDRLRIAYARDRAFGFYYQEDLDALRQAGVELIPLDTLADARLPTCDGLIIGGGFPEVFITELEANRTLRHDLRLAVDAGLPVYAECGGLMYLSRRLTWGKKSGEMAGVVPGDCVMGDRPVGRGYAELEETAVSEKPIPAHEFHYSHLENLPPDLTYAYRVLRGHGIADGRDGYLHNNLIASYCHRRGSGERGWIAPFLAKAARWNRQHGQRAA